MFEPTHMRAAIALSRSFERDRGYTPFGAVVVLDGEVAGEGISAVVRDVDPTAHAEILAIRHACTKVGSHLLPGAALYSSGYPCPLCLMACYWAQVTEVYYAAELVDSQRVGFEDRDFYRELTLPPHERSIRVAPVGEPLRAEAAQVLREWHATLDDSSG